MKKFPCYCPNCSSNIQWRDVLDVMIASMEKEENAKLAAELFGWTPENRLRFSAVIRIWDMMRDEIIYYVCPFCNKEIKQIDESVKHCIYLSI